MEASIYECMIDGIEIESIVIPTQLEHLFLVPSHIDLVGAEVEMINMDNREEKMKEVISVAKDQYDFIIINCSPSLGLITINALTAANSVIIPVQCEYFALEGLGKLLNTIKIIAINTKPISEFLSYCFIFKLGYFLLMQASIKPQKRVCGLSTVLLNSV